MRKKVFGITLIITILIIFLIRVFYSLPNAPLLDCDAISSVEAGRSIIKTGIPLKFNGEFYPRDYLAHYLLAGSIFLFGDNPSGYVIPNLIFSVLVLILLYFFAKKFTKSKMVVFLTIFFVGISTVENTYAINPRSYMQFQFFFLLTVFLFYKGFVEKNNDKEKIKKYKILTIFSYIASCLSHLSGLILMPIFGLYIIIKDRKFYKDKLILIFLLAIILFSVFLFCVKLPIDNSPLIRSAIYYDMPYGFKFKVPFSRFLGKENENSNGKNLESPFNISSNPFSNFPNLFFYLPFISFFILFNIITIIKKRNSDLTYLFYVFLSSFLFISLLSKQGNIKYIFCIFPIFALLSFIGLDNFIKFFIKKINIKNNLNFNYFIWTSVLILILIFVFTVTKNKVFRVNPYGFGSFYNDYRGALNYFINNKKNEDIVISTDPAISRFYLNYNSYWLKQIKIKQKNDKIVWQSYDGGYKKPYNGLMYIDSLNKLKDISNNKRVWVFFTRKTFGPEIEEYILNNTELKYINLENNIQLRFF